MTKIFSTLAFTATLLGGCSTKDIESTKMTTILDVPNPEVRRKGIRDVVTNSPEKAPKETLSLLLRALEDPDSEVRALAAGGLHRIAFFSRGSEQVGGRRLDEDPTARAALLRAARDSSIDVRLSAVQALGVFPGSPDVEAGLLRVLKMDPSPRVRSAAVQSIGAAGYRAAAVQTALVEALEDSDTEVKGWAAKVLTDGGEIPASALVPLAAGIGLSDRFAQHNCILALATFGDRARPYLSILEHLMNKETDESARAVIADAIMKIRE